MHGVGLSTIAVSLMMIGFGTLPAATKVPALSQGVPASIEAFQLPPKTVFDRTMPRYPNVWFLRGHGRWPRHTGMQRWSW